MGQTIAVYELATYDASDVATYTNCYALAPSITSVNVDGGPNSGDNANNAPDEATLDVEEAAALAPGAHLEVYQGTQAGSGPTDIYSEIASQNTATIVTTSWGICEAQTDGAAQVEQAIFEEMAAQGQTVVAAAGDDGSSDCEGARAAQHDPRRRRPRVAALRHRRGRAEAPTSTPHRERLERRVHADRTAARAGAASRHVDPSDLAGRARHRDERRPMRIVPDLSVMADPSTGFIQYYTRNQSGCCQHLLGRLGRRSAGRPSARRS